MDGWMARRSCVTGESATGERAVKAGGERFRVGVGDDGRVSVSETTVVVVVSVVVSVNANPLWTMWTTHPTTMKRGRWNSSYVEGVGVWDDRSAKRRECEPMTTNSTNSTNSTTTTNSTNSTPAGFARDASTPSFSTTTTSVDADMTDVSSPTRRRSCLIASDETGVKRRGGVARALAFGDVSREAFPLDPSATR